MRVLKKINNNVAICQDNNDEELIAIGKGIGFHKTPYELTDLSKIDMTFYRVTSQTEKMLSSIPESVIMVSYKILKIAEQELNGNFSPNILFSLADHIDFAIKRLRKNQKFDFSLSYDIEHLYPQEFKVGQKAVMLINDNLNTNLPDYEAVAIAIHFINARQIPVENITDRLNDELLRLVINSVENKFHLKLDANEFALSRFRIHFKYYLDRLKDNKQISGEINFKLVKDFIDENPKIAECANEIVRIIDGRLHTQTTDDEMFYLMIYIKRMINKTRGVKNE